MLKEARVLTLASRISKDWEKNISPEIKIAIVNETSFLEFSPDIKTRIYWILSLIKEQPYCETCNKPITKLKQGSSRFIKNRWCSPLCAQSSNETKEKIKRSNLERYGVRCTLQANKVKQKTRNTMLERYGVDSALKNKTILSKVKETNLKRYGGNAPISSNCVKRKIKMTSLERYGVENISQCNIIKEKKKQQCFDKWGVSNTFNIKHGPRSQIEPDWNKELEILIDKNVSIENIAKETGYSESYLYKKINTYFPEYIKAASSVSEKEILYLIKNSVGDIEIQTNTRAIIPPKELDIYIPRYKLAIEYNGLYWHSIKQGKDISYHSSKTDSCNENGIRLINVFENEWRNKREIVESNIKRALGVAPNLNSAIYDIRNVSQTSKKDFLNKNHIDGDKESSVNLGLFHKDELVYLLAMKDNEIIRHTNKNGVNVVNGFKLLFKYAIKKYNKTKILVRCNKRWDDNKLYRANNFVFLKREEPSLMILEDNRIWDCGNSVFEWKQNK
jgi:hypothetical protein